jgi:hypothetical protein
VFIAAFIVATVFLPRFYAAGTSRSTGTSTSAIGDTRASPRAPVFLFGRLLASACACSLRPSRLPADLWQAGSRPKGQLIAAIVIIGAVGVAYTVAGGIRAVIVTDCVQLVHRHSVRAACGIRAAVCTRSPSACTRS